MMIRAMVRHPVTAVVCLAAIAVAAGCSKSIATGVDAADAPGASDVAAPADTAPADTARADTAPADEPVGQCPQDLPVDGASCSIPTVTCPYNVPCGERDFLCFAFEVGAPAKWICLGNCSCDAGAD